MKFPKFSGLLQVFLVLTFVLLSLILSRLMKISYEPAVRNGGGERTLYVETTTPLPGPYQIVFETTGTVAARTEINVVPQVSGRIVEVGQNFYPGGHFEAGQTLFKIDPRDFHLEVERLKAEVARAKTRLELENAESSAALSEWKLLNREQPPPPLVAREPQRAEALANLQAAEALLSNAQLNLERSTFDFPFAGRVQTSLIAPGQFVQMGQSYGKVFDHDALEVFASLEGKQLEWLLSTPDAEISILAQHLGKALTFDGTLAQGAASIDRATRFATVRFGFKTPPKALIPGVFARVTIYGPKRDAITQIPTSALQQNGDLWLVEEDDTLTPLRPDILFANAETLAVTNFPSGARLVINRITGATPGMQVTPADRTPIAAD